MSETNEEIVAADKAAGVEVRIVHRSGSGRKRPIRDLDRRLAASKLRL